MSERVRPSLGGARGNGAAGCVMDETSHSGVACRAGMTAAEAIATLKAETRRTEVCILKREVRVYVYLYGRLVQQVDVTMSKNVITNAMEQVYKIGNRKSVAAQIEVITYNAGEVEGKRKIAYGYLYCFAFGQMYLDIISHMHARVIR